MFVKALLGASLFASVIAVNLKTCVGESCKASKTVKVVSSKHTHKVSASTVKVSSKHTHKLSAAFHKSNQAWAKHEVASWDHTKVVKHATKGAPTMGYKWV